MCGGVVLDATGHKSTTYSLTQPRGYSDYKQYSGNLDSVPCAYHEKVGPGYTNSIKRSGCAITSLGNIIKEKPEYINEILKNNKGFNNDNNIIWEKISCLNLKFIGKENDFNKIK
jgi:hypothetical protein